MNETSSKLIKFNLDDYKRVKKLKFCNFKAGVYGAPSWSNSAFSPFLCETNGGCETPPLIKSKFLSFRSCKLMRGSGGSQLKMS